MRDRRADLAAGTFLSVISRHPEGSRLYEDLERGAVTQAEWNAGTAALLGVEGANLMGRVLQDLHPEPSVIAAARSARAQGVRVGIFSNSLGREPYDVYAGYGLGELSDVVLLSEDYRMRKPGAALYKEMLELMGLAGEACVCVDDSARNLPPAAELGIATVHAVRPGDTVAQVEAFLGLRLTEGVQALFLGSPDVSGVLRSGWLYGSWGSDERGVGPAGVVPASWWCSWGPVE